MPAAVRISEKSNDAVFTLGELFPTGSAIDVLSSGHLTLWRDGHEHLGVSAEHEGRSYVATPLGSELQRLLRLPKATDDFGNIELLVSRLTGMIASHSQLDEDSSLLVAAFVLSSWVFDCLPTAPCLNLCGRPGTESTLLNILASVCRRPLPLAQASIAKLSKLPEGLSPTLILNHLRPAALMPVLAAITGSNVSLLAHHRVVDLRYATIVCTQNPIPATALNVHLHPEGSAYRRITQATMEQLADEFQPYLLRYRLTRHREVANSEFDAPWLHWNVRMLARALGAAVEGSPETQARIIEALRRSDEKSKVESSQSPAAVVLEALLVACHEKRPEIHVFEIAELANGIFLGRHDDQVLSPKALGGILRAELGLCPERNARGYALRMSSQTRQRIHKLASTYGTLSMMTPHPDCALCSELASQTLDPGNHIREHVHEVHEVHAVHEVHNQAGAEP
ncbi:MAG: hypothetical protein DMG83_11730 [Acidobacteria bacterium]|nr:MAG: hypothetical protein DMG83_11730 [Acidobacteriota bacterium]